VTAPGDLYTGTDYLRRNPSWHVEDSIWKAGQVLKLLEKNRLSPRSVCDIGCGAGEVLQQLHAQMPDSVAFEGYEIAPAAFELCRTKAVGRLKFFLGGFPEADKAPFDLAMAIDVVEHVEDVFGFLRKIRTLGRFKIFHIPLELSVQGVLRGKPLREARRRSGHLHYFTKETALSTLSDAGHEIVDWLYTAGSIELPGRSVTSKLAKFPRFTASLISRGAAARVLGGYSLLVLTR